MLDFQSSIGFSAEKLPLSRSHRRHRIDDDSCTSTCSSRSAGSSRFQSSPRLPQRDEVDGQASVEAADIDDLVQGDGDGVAQLGHYGRLPLQVLGDEGVIDLPKRRHLRSQLLLQIASSAPARCTLPGQGWLGSACSCRLNWKNHLKSLPRSSK